MSLLTIVQDVTDRIGIPRPSSVVGSSDNQIRMLLSLAQQEGKELSQRFPWQDLLKEATFTTIASETQTSALPSDFNRLIEGSMYNRTQHRPVVGPLNAQRWQQLKSTFTASVWSAFRIRGSAILMNPTPAAGDTIYFEYVTDYWAGVASSTVPTLSAWAADTDIGYLDEELMTLGIQWRYLRARGLDYGEAFNSYERKYLTVSGSDGGERILDLSAEGIGAGWFDPYLKDGSWSVS